MHTTFYKIIFRRTTRLLKVRAMLMAALVVVNVASYGQQASLGGGSVLSGTEITLQGNHSFQLGTELLPGKIATERAAPFGVLSFNGPVTYTGAGNDQHVDGYVLKRGNGSFVFPVGDNNVYAPFAATAADGVSGAYFRADPSTAITSRTILTGGNFGVLPSGGPFSTTSKGTGVSTVSTVEYWDIDGTTSTPITLTWTSASNVTAMTGSDLNKLTIVGWNASTSLWEVISAAVDMTSVLGGASTLAAGSITSTSVIPNTYAAYTLASSATTPDLVPFLSFINAEFTSAITSRPFTATLYNDRPGTSTSGVVTVRIYKPTLASTMALTGSSLSQWSVSNLSNYYLLTANSGVTVAPSIDISGALTIPSATAKGNYNFRALIPDLSGGEVESDNVNNETIIKVVKN